MYNEILEILTKNANKAQELNQKLNETIILYQQQYLGDMYTSMAKDETDRVNAKIDALAKESESKLAVGLGLQQNKLDKVYFIDATPELAAKLEIIANSNLSELELNGYLCKFKDNAPAIRRLEKIAKDNGYRIEGMSASYDYNFLGSITKDFESIISGMRNSQSIAKIACARAASRIKEYNERKSDGALTLKAI